MVQGLSKTVLCDVVRLQEGGLFNAPKVVSSVGIGAESTKHCEGKSREISERLGNDVCQCLVVAAQITMGKLLGTWPSKAPCGPTTPAPTAKALLQRGRSFFQILRTSIHTNPATRATEDRLQNDIPYSYRYACVLCSEICSPFVNHSDCRG
ncbi:hypothetical protein B0H34DRAFT_270927 [Crassisporium funariophilum]|nr:hypothetical protein B0H34DRAFT_270927 [Crassisporium funariophilum]